MIVQRLFLACAFAGIALAGCDGGFSSGTAQPNTILPPSPPSTPASIQATGSKTTLSITGTPPPGDVGAYPFSQAPQGLQCPQVDGFTCVLQFNILKGKHTLAAAATPPQPSPSSSSAVVTSSSASPSPQPSTGPMIMLQLAALPQDAPAPNASPAINATALLSVRMHTDSDVILNGSAIASFTLPREQLTKGRGFAVQLFREAIETRTSHLDKFIGSYTKATLNGTTLHFAFTPPPVAIKKDELWLLVLYGDGSITPATPSPSPAGSALLTPSPLPSGNAE